MALVQLTNALKLVIVEKVHVHSGTTAALATRPLHERGLGKHERSIGTLKQTVAGVEKSPVLAATLPWSPGLVIAVIIRKLVLVVIIIGLRNHCATMMRNGSMLKRKNVDRRTQICPRGSLGTWRRPRRIPRCRTSKSYRDILVITH